MAKNYYPEDTQQLKDIGLSFEFPGNPDAEIRIFCSNDGNRAILYTVGKNGRDDGGYKDSKESGGEQDDRILWKKELQETHEPQS